MTSLFSSLIIEPVFRQARRFSSAPPEASPSGRDLDPQIPPPLSHARHVASSNATPADTGTHIETTTTNLSTANNTNGNVTERTTAGSIARRLFFGRVQEPGASSSVSVSSGAEAATNHRSILITSRAHGGPTHLSASLSANSEPSSLLQNTAPEELRTAEMLRELTTDRLRTIETIGTTDLNQGSMGSTAPGGALRRASAARLIPHRAGTTTAGSTQLEMGGSLPADDGMRLLRQRIHEIRDSPVSNEEKARQMHHLMTERYHKVHIALRAHSPASIASAERPFTPTSPVSHVHSSSPASIHASSPLSISSTIDPENPYNLGPGDTAPSYRPKRTHDPNSDEVADEDADDPEDDQPVLGCKHYKRNVKVQCFDCRKWYPCRHCHDEIEDHHLNRKRTQNMLCMLCSTPQPAAMYCSNCGEQAAWYYCDICKLWDNDSRKSIYHCNDCGLCRRGAGIGKDFVHCKKCNVCISIAYATAHRCIERAIECDCPICGDYMFTSSASVAAMPCGHYMHQACYNAYIEHAYKCPICKKSAVNMELQWRKLEREIESQPMPPQFADTRIVVHCNDCSAKTTVRYHWLGNQCGVCDSFNTNDLQLITSSSRDADELSVLRSNPNRPNRVRIAARDVRVPRGSYFLNPGDEPEAEASDDASSRSRRVSSSAMDGLRYSTYEMLQRMSRSLSPIRHYLARLDDEMADVEFWGTDGRFLSIDDDSDEDEEGSSDEYEDDEDDEESGEEDEEGDYDDGDDDDDDEELGDGDDDEDIELFGHR